MLIQKIIRFHLHIKVKRLFDLKTTAGNTGLQESLRGELLASTHRSVMVPFPQVFHILDIRTPQYSR